MQNEKRWMDIKETASYIRMSKGFLRKAVRNKSIPFTRIGTKSLRFDREALDKWMAANGEGGELIFRKS